MTDGRCTDHGHTGRAAIEIQTNQSESVEPDMMNPTGSFSGKPRGTVQNTHKILMRFGRGRVYKKGFRGFPCF